MADPAKLRLIDPPFVAPGPCGVAIRDRLKGLTAGDERVLRERALGTVISQSESGPGRRLGNADEKRSRQVNSVRGLYERFRQLIHEGAKFGIVGGVGFLVTDGGTNFLQSMLRLGWLKANVIATLAATIVTFLGSRYWTFRHRERSGMGRETVLFLGLNGMGLGIQLACLGFANYALGLTDKFSSNVALFLGICLGTLFRFWSYRKWVWIAPTAGPALGPAEFAAAQLSDMPSGAAVSRSAPGPGG